ncbi:protein MTO1 homolog, mitochondrial-like isoform X2 [Dreissena polymorpha]|uniref:protein MTO1 homolog, mitochondrial-like isoform X2 n=1 Tax=Dreissena polymorpha TaxID=45954 RepID=UPI002264E72B|nr:protein MTO1 homolog, mitochondrial-like isoform X2 [Dreissena polymorpha]
MPWMVYVPEFVGPRAQIDRDLYKRHMQAEILGTSNLTVTECAVEDLILTESQQSASSITKSICKGVILSTGEMVESKTVVITTGTFLRGCINIGLSVRPAGRIGDEPAIGLARSLEKAGFTMGRLKTGTPPRLDKNTIDYTQCGVTKGDNPPEPFSYLSTDVWIKADEQLDCHITRTSLEIEQIVHDSLPENKHVKEELSGPRYCPSLESKVLKFPGRTHQVWLEPEGFSSDLVYPNGLSCTMPAEYQQRIINLIPGLQRAKIVRPGYGVEYDYIDPRQLRPTLETLPIENLFLAGQINGTTGYEEAAAQGIIAGINAGLKGQNHEPFIVDRTEGYIGVLIDDLTTHGTNEPYRMFPSRAEFRICLRADNADMRLTRKGYKTGCVQRARYESACRMADLLDSNLDLLRSLKLETYKWDELLSRASSRPKGKVKSAVAVLQMVSIDELIKVQQTELGHLQSDRILKKRLEIEALYMLEIEKQQEEISEVRKDELLVLPMDIDYLRMPNNRGLPNDVRLKLAESRPHTIGAASRIPGMTPAALVYLLKFVKSSKTKLRFEDTL